MPGPQPQAPMAHQIQPQAQPAPQQGGQQPGQSAGAPPSNVIQQMAGGGNATPQPVQPQPPAAYPTQPQPAAQPAPQQPQPYPTFQQTINPTQGLPAWEPDPTAMQQMGGAPPAAQPQAPVQQPAQPVAQQQPAQPAQHDPILQHLQGLGYDTSQWSTGQEFLNTLTRQMPHLQNIDQLQALARIGAQSLGQHAQDPQQGQQLQQPAPAEQPLWNPPQFDPTWERFLEVDQQTGRYKPIMNDPALMRYADMANQHLEYRHQAAENFWKDPYSFMWQGLQPKVNEQFTELQEQFQQLQQDYETRRFWDLMERYENDLFVRDQQGQIDYGSLTPAGEAFRKAYFEDSTTFRDEKGKPLPIEQRMHYAYGQAAPHIERQMQQPAQPQQPQPGQPQPTQQQPSQPAPAQPQNNGHHPQSDQLSQSNEEFLSRAYAQAAQSQQAQPPTQLHHVPDQGGSIASAAQQQIVQNPTQTWDQLAEDTQKQMGVTLD